MKALLFLVALLFSFAGNGQTVLKVVTVDRMTHDVVKHAMVELWTDSVKTAAAYSNKEGITYLTTIPGKEIRVVCEHVAYETTEQEISPRSLNRDTLKVVVQLQFVRMIEGITVLPDGTPEKIFASDKISVDDFEVLPDGRYLLLTYAKNKKKGTELFLYDGGSEMSKIPTEENENGVELLRDFRGNTHLVTNKQVYGIKTVGNEVHMSRLEKDYFMSYIAPIVDTSVSKYYFSNFNPDYPAFEYFTYDLLDSSYRKIANIEDELMMELYRAEYKWADVRTKLWAKDMENQTGIDAEIWVGASYFTQSIYYKELYAPLFKRNDSLFLFDHYKNLLFHYNEVGDLLDSVPIFYHLQEKENGWKKELQQDPLTGQVYSIYEKNGQYTLKRIDLKTGEAIESVPLHHKYPDKILVRGNVVYYTYRQFETAQKKYLWREKLPFRFPRTDVPDGDDLTNEVNKEE